MIQMLLGPVLLVAAAVALGRLAMSALRVRLYRGEEWALGFIAGSACLTAPVAMLAAAHQGRKGAFVAVAVLAVALAAWHTRGAETKPLPDVPRAWMLALGAVLAVFGGLYGIYAAAPEIAGGERLGLAFREWYAHRLFAPPEPVRMLYLFAFSFGRHSSAALVHLAFLFALPLAILSYARRAGFAAAGAFAAILVFASPAAAVTGTAALDDAILACLLFGAFYLWRVGGRGALAMAGVLALFALWVRHDGVPAAFTLRDPRVLAVLGTASGSLLGPVFLLAPFALLALRYREGRRLVAAAALVGLPGLAGGEARWMVPCLPFLALAIGLAFQKAPGALGALAAAEAVFCFPLVVPAYTEPDAWRLHGIPLQAALRRVPENEYLNSRLPGYVEALLLEQCVPPGAQVFALTEVAREYTRAAVITGGVPRDALLTPLRAQLQPARELRFRFAARRIRGVRLRGAGTVAEFRVLAGGREAPRSPGWRLRARPEVRDAALAFDNSSVTRWTGTSLEAEFAAPVEADAVVLACPRSQSGEALALELRTEDGTWVAAGAAEVADVAPPLHLREAAMEELRARAIPYLLVRSRGEGAADFRDNAAIWGITPVMELFDACVYRVD